MGCERERVALYDPYDCQIHEDPYPAYRRLREEAPVYHNPERGFYALSRYRDVLAGFRDTARLSNEQGVAIEQIGRARETMSFLGMDPPDHTRLRNLVSSGFTPRRVGELEPRIRALATHYIDQFVDRGSCELIGEFAGKLPMDVISEMLGVPEADRDTLRTWSDTVLHREEGRQEVPPEGLAAAARLVHYFTELVARRRARPQDDLTDALIAAEIEGDRLADADIIGFLFLMVIAGNETTTKLLGNALYWAWRNPDQLARIRGDAGLIPGWAEETLRYDPSSQLIARTALADIELHGRVIPKGARVALLIGSANRDERYWKDPDLYDVGRNTSGSLAFGQGTHFCLGASLARLEARVSLEELLRRLGEFTVRPEGIERVHSANVRGFSALPIEFGG
jgi:cytochrome P450